MSRSLFATGTIPASPTRKQMIDAAVRRYSAVITAGRCVKSDALLQRHLEYWFREEIYGIRTQFRRLMSEAPRNWRKLESYKVRGALYDI